MPESAFKLSTTIGLETVFLKTVTVTTAANATLYDSQTNEVESCLRGGGSKFRDQLI